MAMACRMIEPQQVYAAGFDTSGRAAAIFAGGALVGVYPSAHSAPPFTCVGRSRTAGVRREAR